MPDPPLDSLIEVLPGRRLRIKHWPICEDSSSTLLLVHGSGAKLDQFEPLVGIISQNGGALGSGKVGEVVAFDYLGCGGSDKPDDWDAYATPRLVDDLTAIYTQFCRRPGKKIIMGHSFGTSLILEMVAGLPEGQMPAAIVLLGSDLSRDFSSQRSKYDRPDHILRELQPANSRAFADVAVHPDAIGGALYRSLIDHYNSNPLHTVRAFTCQKRWASAAQVAAVSASAVPALLITGAADRITTVAEGAALAAALQNASGEGDGDGERGNDDLDAGGGCPAKSGGGGKKNGSSGRRGSNGSGDDGNDAGSGVSGGGGKRGSGGKRGGGAAQFEVVEGAGHQVHQERPAEVHRLVNDFLAARDLH
ncbi:unnamed protein product [Phaeothamnion confervicola]